MRKNPTAVVVVAMGFCGGILLRGILKPGLEFFVVTSILMTFVFGLRLCKIKWDVRWFLVLISVTLGYACSHLHYLQLAEPLPEAWHGQEAWVEGEVDGFPYKDQEGAWHLKLIHVQKCDHEDRYLAIAGVLQVTLDCEDSLLPIPGNRIRLLGSFSCQPGRINFGDPNWQEIQYRRNIVGRFYAEQAIKLNQETTSFHLFRGIWSFRRYLYQGLYERMQTGQGRLSKDHASFLIGLTLGVGDDLPEQWQKDFQVAGLLHLLAVSGGNVAFFLMGLGYCIRVLPFSRRVELGIFIVAVGFFIVLTAMESSVVRAGTMAGLVLLSRFWLRKTHWPSLMAVSVLTILLFQPFMIYEMGFQLSFFAVWGLFVWAGPFMKFLEIRWHWPVWLAATMGATLAAQLAVLPYSLVLFHQISLIAPFSNLLFATLIIPASPLLVLLLLSIPMGPVMGWLFGLSSLYLELLIRTGSFFAELPGASLQVPVPPGWMVLTAYLLQFLLRYRPCKLSQIQYKRLAWGFLAIVFLSWWHPWPYPLEVVLLDVGQGESVFIRFPNGKTMLVDGGGSMLGESQIGNQVVVPYLQRLGIRALDLVVLTHAHGDHYQGLLQIDEEIPFRLFLHGLSEKANLPSDLEVWLRNQPQSKVRLLEGGESILIDPDVLLEVKQAQFSGDGSNNDSVVLYLRFGQTELWLTGDMEKEAEAALKVGNEFSTSETLLKVAHHGGATSTSESLLSRTSPEIALISAGRSNRYGHPSPEVVERLKQVGCEVYVTAWQGAIACKSNGQEWEIRTCRPSSSIK